MMTNAEPRRVWGKAREATGNRGSDGETMTTSTSERSIESILRLSPVLTVVTLHDVDRAVDVAHALLAGGLRTVEITLRTPAALAAIEAIARAVPEIRVGAGTVLSAQDLRSVIQAGASFAISPGATPELLAAGADAPIPYLPAVATPSEIMAALAAGYRCLKFFPVSALGGVPMLQALAGPFPQVRFSPSGGITPETAGAYLALPNVICIGASWITPADALAQRDWARIESLARAAAGLARRE